MIKSQYLKKIKYKNLTDVQNIFNKIIENILIKISDKRIKNPKTFEHQTVNKLFIDKVRIKNGILQFIDERNIHDLIKANFYFSNPLLNIVCKIFGKKDVAIIMAFDFGRTGNRFNELGFFIQFGLSLELKHIFLDSDDPMFNLEDNDYVLPVSKIPSNSIKIRCKNAIFFHQRIWDLDIYDYQKHEKQAKNILSKIFSTNKVANLDNKDLVIHIRGGDIFDPLSPPVARLQPPYSWYVAIINHHQAKYGLRRIIIVFEDKKNPCVDALIGYARSQKITCEISSSSISNDYRWLMGAKVLVPSWGTFCDPAISLNSDLECIYRFSDDQIVGNTYIKRGEWYASPDQIKLMIELPIDSVVLKNY